MGYVDVSRLCCVLPDGRVLFADVSFRVGEGAKTALVGANGTGKTTLLRMVAGDLDPASGAIARSGGVGVMRQFIGSIRGDTTVRDLLLSLAASGVRDAGLALDAAELAMMEQDDEKAQMRYATALSDWADAHGYDAEVVWDTCTTAALGVHDAAARRADRQPRPRQRRGARRPGVRGARAGVGRGAGRPGALTARLPVPPGGPAGG